MITHLTLDGAAAVAAETGKNPETHEQRVRVYLGDSLIITMPVDVADALGDALADADAVVMTRRDFEQ
jgi:hypothetical protein